MSRKWVPIINRQFSPSEFEKYVLGLKWISWRPTIIVLHNTFVPRLDQWNPAKARERMRNFEHYYRDIKGWSAGPHLFIDQKQISVFTPLTVSGVHSPSWNTVSLGVEMVGDYTAEPFDHQVRDTTVSALATLHAHLGLDSHSLHFHREDPRTSHKNCPGSNVSKSDMIDRIHHLILTKNSGEHLQNRAIQETV